MKFFLDENLSSELKGVFKGFEVEGARSVGLRGASDTKIADYARNHQAILVTKDLEFGSMLLYPKSSHYGLVILRLPFNFTTQQIADRLQTFLAQIDSKELINAITIAEIDRCRIRKI